MNKRRKIVASFLTSLILLTNLTPLAAIGQEVTNINVDLSYTEDSLDSVNYKLEEIITLINKIDRTVSVLDVAKLVNVNSMSNMDYQPGNFQEDTQELLDELRFADILEFFGNKLAGRESLHVESSASPEYAGQLEYLIKNNLLTRDTYYMYDDEGIQVSQRRLKNPSDTTITPRAQDNNNMHEFYKDTSPVSRTDFLTNLMKTNEILSSKPLVVQNMYQRMGTDLIKETVGNEPLETSPYSRYMGELGIDPNSHDVIIGHNSFEQLDIVRTSDVVEQYLSKALSLNIISQDQIGGTEGSAFLTQNSNRRLNDGWKNVDKPSRQFYIPINPTEKQVGDLVKYQKDLYESIIGGTNKTSLNIACVESGILPIWGETYSYSISKCAMANPYNNKRAEIVKRPSSIQVKSGFKSNTGDPGYQFFKEEELTRSQAYILVYKFLQSIGHEPTIVNPEYINSKYALNLTSYTEEERKAVEYLIASGIINGDDNTLPESTYTRATNRDMIDIMYRVHNKSARYELIEDLTETDKDMAKKGFSQATINMSNKESNKLEFYREEIENGRPLQEVQIDDRIKNPFQYDMVYIRIPKNITDKVYKQDEEGNESVNGRYNLITDDNNRAIIDPLNRVLNGGVLGLEHNTSGLKDGEDLYEGSGKYVFRDKDGYYWHRYLLHKDLSNKVMISSFSNEGSSTIRGIKGEGIYFAEEGKNKVEFIKVGFDKAEKHPVTKRIYKNLVEYDIETRTKLQLSNQASNETSNNPNLLWKQLPYADGTQTIQSRTVWGQLTESGLEVLTYKGEPMFSKTGDSANGQNGWEMVDDLPMDRNLRANYSLKYDSSTQLYRIELASTSLVEIESLIETDFIKSPKFDSQSSDANLLGYVKILSNGEELIMVSEEELKHFKIERTRTPGSPRSDKNLMNKSTGQRAFLDTEVNMTFIGNNVTTYPADHMMVYSLGGELYYNLKIVMELMNDSKLVYDRAGKDIFLNTTVNVDTNEVFKLTGVRDILNGGTEAPIIDYTYMMHNTSNVKTKYMNLSALTGAASNFLVYKNRDGENDFEALVVYRPNLESIPESHVTLGTEKGKHHYVDNGVMSFVQHNTDISTKLSNRYAKLFDDSAKDMVLDKLFDLGTSSGSDVLPGDYILDVYVINTSTAQSSHTESIKKFINFVTDGNDVKERLFLKGTNNDPTVTGIPLVEYDYNDKVRGVNLNYVQASTNTINDFDNFILHRATGNLYYKMRTNGNSSNHLQLEKIVKQRFYYDTDKEEIRLRRKIYYENTPENTIPLELYAKPNQRDFGGLVSSDGLTDGYNFPNQKYKLTIPKAEENKAQADANFIIPLVEAGAEDYGLFTGLELPYVNFTSEQIVELTSLTNDEFAEAMLDITIDHFNENTDKTYLEVEGEKEKYPYRDAIGNMENKFAVEAGYANDLTADSKKAFMTGSWAGTLSDNPAYYFPRHCLEDECEHEKHYTATFGPDIKGGTAIADHFGETLFYLHEINNPSDTVEPTESYAVKRTTAIKNYNGLPKDIKDIIKAVGEDDDPIDLPIQFKPSIAIPAGTTVVTLEGELRLLPNPIIRTKMSNSLDIVNNMLARMQEIDTVSTANFLGELNEGSLIDIGGRYFIKTSMSYDMKNKGGDGLPWVRAILIPQSNTSGGYINNSVTEYNESKLTYDAFEELSTITLPTINGIANINLTDTLGPGMFRLPTLKEFHKAKSYHQPGLTSSSSYLKDIDQVFLMELDGALTKEELNDYRAYPTLYKYKSDAIDGYTIKPKKKGIPLVSVMLPPSIQVEERGLETNGKYKSYKALKYWDIGAFTMDPNDRIVNILRSHDTPAESIQGILDSLRKAGLDGTHFTKYSFSKFVEQLYDIVLIIFLRGIPILIILLWLLVALITSVFWFPKTKDWGSNLNRKFGKDLINKISLGVVTVEDENPNLIQFMFASIALWGLAFLVWDGYIIRIIIFLVTGNSYEMDQIKDIFKGF